ncbi:hypothetical protein MKY34_16845 [Sporosarcina sp. FSL K6-1522]|uniref:hypothetical protein n=1 Tax=Sporosarcina sp. FSL K6-1522 TaxID=2921554 RepID=UPI00315A4053
MTGKTTAERLTQHLDINGKEYYEQLKKRRIWTDAHGNRFATVDEIEYKRLVEQAERVRKLEELCDDRIKDHARLHVANRELGRENQRFREALEKIAHDPEVQFFERCPEVAREALEGLK